MTGQIRKVLSEDPSEFDPRKYLKPAMEGDGDIRLCKQRLQELYRRPGQQVQESADHRRDGEALHQGRA